MTRTRVHIANSRKPQSEAKAHHMNQALPFAATQKHHKMNLNHIKTYLLASATALLLAAGTYTTQAQTAQGVSITPNGPSEPHPNAILEIQGDNKGVLVPRVDYDRIDQDGTNDIVVDESTGTDPAGLLVYCNSGQPPLGEGYYYYDTDDDMWKKLGGEGIATDWYPLTPTGGLTFPDGTPVPALGSGAVDQSQLPSNRMPLAMRTLPDGRVQVRGYIYVQTPTGNIGVSDFTGSYLPDPSGGFRPGHVIRDDEGTSTQPNDFYCSIDSQNRLRVWGSYEAGQLYYIDLEY